MNFLYPALIIIGAYCKDIYCDKVNVTTTPDNPGNVIKNGVYNENWTNSNYISYVDAEKIRFFILGLPSNSNISLSHSDESKDINKKWLYTELSTHTERNSEDWVLEVVQECLPRKNWKSIELTLKFDQCKLKISWARNCGNRLRVLSSLNAGFSGNTSELILNGETTETYSPASSGKLPSTTKDSWPIYIWTRIKDNDIELDLNVTYKTLNSTKLIDSSPPQLIPFNNSAFLEITKNCSSPGKNRVDLSIEFINLQTFFISFSYNCESSVTSYSVFKIITILVVFSLLFMSLAVLCLRYRHKLTLFRDFSKTDSRNKSAYLPDREFPDIQFSDLTFRTESKAYGTV